MRCLDTVERKGYISMSHVALRCFSLLAATRDSHVQDFRLSFLYRVCVGGIAAKVVDKDSESLHPWVFEVKEVGADFDDLTFFQDGQSRDSVRWN